MNGYLINTRINFPRERGVGVLSREQNAQLLCKMFAKLKSDKNILLDTGDLKASMF